MLDNMALEAYLFPMTDPTQHTAEQIAADLAASEAELEAGLFVSGEEVRAHLQAVLARMRAEQRDELHHKVSRRP